MALFLAPVAVCCGLLLAATSGTPHGAERFARPSRRPMLAFRLVLRQPGAAHLQPFLLGLGAPGSPRYHRYLSARAFGAHFGLSPQRLGQLRALLRGQGVTVLASYPQRTTLDVQASPEVSARLFGVRLRGSADGTPRVPVAFGHARVPRMMRGFVSAVSGLGPGPTELPDDVPAGGLLPTDAHVAYDLAPLYRQQITGQGETVAIISFANFNQSDLDRFDAQLGLPALHPVSVPVDGGATDTDPGDEAEVALDLELVHETAPSATILDYNAPQAGTSSGDTLGAIIDRIVADGRTKLVSDSWGACELETSRTEVLADERAIEAAEAQGISIFKAAGDAGAYQCQRSDLSDHRLSVEWPTSSPGVIAVGGTALSIDSNGSYAGETAWEGALEQSGTGGGLSTYFPRPAWQSAPGVRTVYSNGKRQIPDVAANADPSTGWTAFTNGSAGQIGGTSAATPFWVGSMALIDEYAQRHGATRVGFVTPMLYAIASTPQVFPSFHDITIGANRYYPATRGWDFATGLGSPDVYNLAQDVTAYLKRHHAG